MACSCPTEELHEVSAPGGPYFGIHSNFGGRYVVFGGGIPLCRGGRIVGGIGVSGGTTEQDVAAARAGVDVWEAHLGAGLA